MSKIIKRNLLMSAGVSAMLTFGSVGGAVAQPAAAPGDSGVSTLQEIVVTARKREENLQTTPLAVTAFNANMLAKQQINSTADLAKTVPSLIIEATPSVLGASSVVVRGLGNTNPTNLMGDAQVASYVDGVYEGRALGNVLSLVDMERIEVEAGPQGTLFGRNVTGGAISYFTKGPAKRFGVEEKVSYGSFNDILTRTTLDTGELGDTGFYAKLAYMHHQMDGFQRNAVSPSRSEDPGAISDNSYFFALDGDLAHNVTVDYKFDWDAQSGQTSQPALIGASKDFAALSAESVALGGSGYQISATPLANGFYTGQTGFKSHVNALFIPNSTFHSGGHNLTLNWTVNDDIQVKSITAYRQLAGSANTNFTGQPPGMLGFEVGSFAPVPLLQLGGLAANQGQNQWSEEVQLNGKFDRVDYVVGLYYFDEHVTESSFDSTALLPVPVPFLAATLESFGQSPAIANFLQATYSGLVPNTPYGKAVALNIGSSVDSTYTGESTSRAAYFDASYTPPILSDKLELSVGTRYTWDTKRISQTLPAILPTNETKNFYNLAGSGSIKYRWTKDVMAYFRVGTAYTAGGFNPQNSSAGQVANSYNPEGVLSYEIGVKSDFFDHHVRLNADGYFTDYTGEQITQFSGAEFGPELVNAGRAHYWGLEAQLTVLPARGWQLDGTLGLIAPKYTEFDVIPGVNSANIATFADLSRTTASADVIYDFDPMPVGDLSVRVDWSYHSPRYTAAGIPSKLPIESTFISPAFNDVGAEINLANIPINAFGLTFDAEAYGKNLLDKHDLAAVTDLAASLGIASASWNIGRTFGVMLTGKF